MDYLQPGGIYRDAALRVVPEVFLSDVFAKPADVLGAGRQRRVQCLVDAATVPPGPLTVTAELLDGLAPARHRGDHGARSPRPRPRPGRIARLDLRDAGDVTLWSPDHPKLYTVRATCRRRQAATPRRSATPVGQDRVP